MLSPMSQASALPAGYPAQWEADVVLRDGSVAHLRPITPSDVAAVHRFHAGQSDESIYMRFFAPLRQLSDRDVTRFTNVDYHDRVALVATVRGDIIGIGRYDRITPTSTKARGSARSCSNTSRSSPGSQGSKSSPPRCCRRTAR
jgi:hypothetical protein